MFKDGEEYEEIVDTEAGVFWIVASIAISGTELYLHDLLFYPATAARLNAGYASVRAVFRHIESRAQQQGFTTCTVTASRSKRAKPRRMLSIRKTLV
jgi:hypothetical protein